ncbi:MAG: hypothetical protein EOO65_00630, partial [Methanosarcinales archaeon]
MLIQRYVRTFVERARYKALLQETTRCATAIQKAARGWLARRKRDRDLYYRENEARAQQAAIAHAESAWIISECEHVERELQRPAAVEEMERHQAAWRTLQQTIWERERDYLVLQLETKMADTSQIAVKVTLDQQLLTLRNTISEHKKRALFDIALPMRRAQDQNKLKREYIEDLQYRLSRTKERLEIERADTFKVCLVVVAHLFTASTVLETRLHSPRCVTDCCIALHVQRSMVMEHAVEEHTSALNVAAEKRKWQVLPITETGKPDFARIELLRKVQDARNTGKKGNGRRAKLEREEEQAPTLDAVGPSGVQSKIMSMGDTSILALVGGSSGASNLMSLGGTTNNTSGAYRNAVATRQQTAAQALDQRMRDAQVAIENGARPTAPRPALLALTDEPPRGYLDTPGQMNATALLSHEAASLPTSSYSGAASNNYTGITEGRGGLGGARSPGGLLVTSSTHARLGLPATRFFLESDDVGEDDGVRSAQLATAGSLAKTLDRPQTPLLREDRSIPAVLSDLMDYKKLERPPSNPAANSTAMEESVEDPQQGTSRRQVALFNFHAVERTVNNAVSRHHLSDLAKLRPAGRYNGPGADQNADSSRAGAADFVAAAREDYIADAVVANARRRARKARDRRAAFLDVEGMSAAEYAAWMVQQAMLEEEEAVAKQVTAATVPYDVQLAAEAAAAGEASLDAQRAGVISPASKYNKELYERTQRGLLINRKPGDNDFGVPRPSIPAEPSLAMQALITAQYTEPGSNSLSSMARTAVRRLGLANAGPYAGGYLTFKEEGREEHLAELAQDAAQSERVTRMVDRIAAINTQADTLQHGALLKPLMEGMSRVMANAMAADATAGAVRIAGIQRVQREQEIKAQIEAARAARQQHKDFVHSTSGTTSGMTSVPRSRMGSAVGE